MVPPSQAISRFFYFFLFPRALSPPPFSDRPARLPPLYEGPPTPPRRFSSFPEVCAEPIPAWRATPPPAPEASSGPPPPACRPFLGDVRSSRPTPSASPPLFPRPL